MTPTSISSILMYIILPAKIDTLMNGKNPDKNVPIDKKITTNEKSKKYIIYFGGSGQDCIKDNFNIQNIDNSSIIFWNYPGVGNSHSPSNSPEDLYRARYSIVKDLIKDKILPENITLHGWLLGGHVASEVARRLCHKNYFVHLESDRTFSTISAAIPEKIKVELFNTEDTLNADYTSSLLGVSALMLTIVGLPNSIINTTTLMLINALALAGYCIAFAIESIGIILQEILSGMGYEEIGAYLAMPFIELGNLVNQTINLIAELIYEGVWSTFGVASFVILLPMLLAGMILGFISGALPSIQLLWTKRPIVLPMHMMVEAALIVKSCSMNTANAIKEIISLNQTPEIKNTKSDEAIIPSASLYNSIRFS